MHTVNHTGTTNKRERERKRIEHKPKEMRKGNEINRCAKQKIEQDHRFKTNQIAN